MLVPPSWVALRGMTVDYIGRSIAPRLLRPLGVEKSWLGTGRIVARPEWTHPEHVARSAAQALDTLLFWRHTFVPIHKPPCGSGPGCDVWDAASGRLVTSTSSTGPHQERQAPAHTRKGTSRDGPVFSGSPWNQIREAGFSSRPVAGMSPKPLNLQRPGQLIEGWGIGTVGELAMSPEEFRKRAEECLELAREASLKDPLALLKIAEAWRDLAYEAARRLDDAPRLH